MGRMARRNSVSKSTAIKPALIALLADGVARTLRDIYEHFGISQSMTSRLVWDLEDEGRVVIMLAKRSRQHPKKLITVPQFADALALTIARDREADTLAQRNGPHAPRTVIDPLAIRYAASVFDWAQGRDTD